MNATELTKLLTISENIQEQIQIAGDLWELSDFEITAPVSYTHLRAHETPEHLVCRLLLEKKK